MGKAICNTCGTRAVGKTVEEAISKLNHAIGRSRNINCGVNSDNIVTTGFTTKKVESPKPNEIHEIQPPSSITTKKTETSKESMTTKKTETSKESKKPKSSF